MTTSSIHPIRESLTRLPVWTQAFFTWLTGYALPGQKRLFNISPELHILIAVATLLLSIAGGIYLAYQLEALVVALL
jgi:hypothetical protein